MVACNLLIGLNRLDIGLYPWLLEALSSGLGLILLVKREPERQALVLT